MRLECGDTSPHSKGGRCEMGVVGFNWQSRSSAVTDRRYSYRQEIVVVGWI
jgi:hypothetical protein